MCLEIVCHAVQKDVDSELSAQHADDGGPLGIGNGVENLKTVNPAILDILGLY